MSYVATAGVAIGATESVIGLINAGKAKDEAAFMEKTRPKRSISPYAKDELSLAESELANGMNAAVESAYQEGIDRSLSSSLGATLKYGGGVNMVGELFDKSAQAQQRLAMMQENIRLNQINNTVAAYREMSSELDKNFQFNQWAPWADKTQANAVARQQASNMIMSGVNTAGGALLQGLAGADSEKDYNNYMKDNSYYTSPDYKPQTQGYTIDTPRNVSGANAPINIGNAQPLNIEPIGGDSYQYNNPDTGQIFIRR